jgi:hypothetical protein
MRKILLALSLAASLSAHGAGTAPSPESVVETFYAALMKTPAPPLVEELKALSVFLSQDLNGLIAGAQQAEAAYLKKYPTDKGILGNGTCFFYGGGDCAFTSYRVVKTLQSHDAVKVTVHLTLLDSRPGYPATSWQNVVALKREKERWVINDIEYFGSSASRNLKDATDEARRAVQR